MNLKHLKQGSVCPELGPGVLRCYNMKFCPYAQRTLLILYSKGIDFEVVNINLKNPPDWFLEKNKLGKVPVLEQDSQIMIESLVTCEYLDEKYPEPSMFPKNSWEKAQEKGFIQIINSKLIEPMFKATSIRALNDPILLKILLDKIKNALHLMEEELIKRNTLFYGGNRPNIVDYGLWPWIERLTIIPYASAEEIKILEENIYPHLVKYIQRMNLDKAVQATKISLDDHLGFIKSYVEGMPDYDYGLEKLAKL